MNGTRSHCPEDQNGEFNGLRTEEIKKNKGHIDQVQSFVYAAFHVLLQQLLLLSMYYKPVNIIQMDKKNQQKSYLAPFEMNTQ